MIPVRVERRQLGPSLWGDPFGESDWFSDAGRFVDRFFGNRTSGGWYPADVWEDEGNLHVAIEMPGLTADDVQVNYEDGLLRIEGDKKLPGNNGRQYHLSERRFGKFVRTFQLPNVVDPDSIKATFKDGILTITLAKRPETKARKIEIKGE